MRALTFLRRTLLPALAGALVALPCAAQVPPLKLALELTAAESVRGDAASAQSVTRRVATHLTPDLEAAGWQVVRVYSAKKAAKSGRFDASVRVDVDARPVYNVRDAKQYANEAGKQVVLDYSKSVQAWGKWAVWDGSDGAMLFEGDIYPISPKLQAAGAGQPELDDEESIARLLAEAAMKAVGDSLKYTRAGE